MMTPTRLLTHAFLAGLICSHSTAHAESEEPEIQWLLDNVPHFQVVSLPTGTGNFVLPASASYTVEDLRGKQFDNDPPSFSVPNTWPDEGYVPSQGPYVSPNLAPFMLKYFTCEFSYGGTPNYHIQDYAATHGYRVALGAYANSANSMPEGNKRLMWGTFTDIPAYVAANGITAGRWDQFYDFATQPGKDIVNDFVQGINGTGAAWNPQASNWVAMLDLEFYDVVWNAWEGLSIFSPSVLRTKPYYPSAGTPEQKADFERRYYQGFALSLTAPAQALKRNGWKQSGLYTEPFTPDHYRLAAAYSGGSLWDDVMVNGLPDPATCWHWKAFNRTVVEAQSVLYPDCYSAYAGVNNVGFTLAKIDYMHALTRTVPNAPPDRPYLWPHLHGGDNNNTWWNTMPIPPEDMRAMAALLPFSGADGHVIWEFNRYNYHVATPLWLEGWQSWAGITPVPGGAGNNVVVAAPFSLWPVGADTGTTQPTQFSRYDVLSVTSMNAGGTGLVEFEHHPFNLLSTPGGVGSATTLPSSLPSRPGQPRYRISSTTLNTLTMRESESVRGAIEGLATLKPIERLVYEGEKKIDTPAINQMMEWKPSVRRVRTEKYDIIATHDPGAIRHRAPTPVVINNFEGSGLNVTLPADEQVRIYVLRRDTRTASPMVSTGLNDAGESAAGNVSLNSAALTLGGGETTGLRFENVGIPQGATIKHAQLRFVSTANQSTAANLLIAGEAVDNSAVLTATIRNLSERDRTVAGVSWSPGAWAAEEYETTPNLAALVQEITDRAGWQNGQALTLLLSGSGSRSVAAQESGGGRAAVLTVEFTPAPVITTGPVTSITSTSAMVTGKLRDSGGLPATITIYWGKYDAGLSKQDWENVAHCGVQPSGEFQTLLTGMQPDTRYFYRCHASNSLADAWSAESMTCTTLNTSGQWLVRVPVMNADDDGEEYPGGVVSLGSSDLELTYDNYVAPPRPCYQTVGIRFAHVPIPQGATLISANIQFTTREVNSAACPPLLIQCQAADHAAAFVGTGLNISSRARAAASVSWTPPAWSVLNENGAAQKTPNLAAMINEVISRPGWSENNALAFFITGNGNRNAWARDSSGEYAPVLVLEYAGSGIRHVESYPVTEDVEEYPNGTVTRESGDIELVNDSLAAGNQTVGLRFGGMRIPRRAGIQSARIQFVAKDASVASPASSLLLQGLDAGQAGTFLSSAFNVSQRTRTSTSVSWTAPAWAAGGNGEAQQTPDLKTIVQEIVNQGAWEQGSPLGFVITGSGVRNAWSLEGNANAAAILHVQWSPPAPSGADANDNEILDAWEQTFLGGTNAGNSVYLPAYLTGGGPGSLGNPYGISINRSGSQETVVFQTTPALGIGYENLERYYRVEQSTDLIHWAPAYGATRVLGDGNTYTYTNALPSARGFYRVKVWLE